MVIVYNVQQICIYQKDNVLLVAKVVFNVQIPHVLCVIMGIIWNQDLVKFVLKIVNIAMMKLELLLNVFKDIYWFLI